MSLSDDIPPSDPIIIQIAGISALVGSALLFSNLSLITS